MSGAVAFDTPLGPCALAWGAKGITRSALPFASSGGLAAWLERHGGDAPLPPPVRAAADGIAALLGGAAVDFIDAPLDFTGIGEVEQRIHRAVMAIPPGETRSYGQIAAALGDPTLARAVGQAMARNPFPPIVPCHRVLAAGGRPGGFSAPGGLATKRRLLAIESVHARRADDLFTRASAG